MGAKNQADADNSTTAADDKSAEDSTFNPDSVTSADEWEQVVANVAAAPVDPDTVEKDKELSAKDEEDNSDPDGDVSYVDPDDEGSDDDGDDASGDDSGDGDGDESDSSADDDDGADDDSDKDESDDDSDSGDDDGDSGDGDDDGDDASDDQKKLDEQERFRVRSKDPLTKETLRLLSRNRDLDIEQARELARKNLVEQGVIKDESAGKDDGDDASDDGMPKTVEDAESRISDLEAQAKTAMEEDFDFTKASELQAEINKLNRHIGTLQLNEVQREKEEQESARAKYIENFNASQAKAEATYDFAKDPESEGSKLMSEIDERLKEAGDPRYSDPNKPLIVAQMVARELNIAPKGKTVKKSPDEGKPGKPNKSGKKATVQPARGDSRTKEKSDKGQLDERIDKISSVEDYEKLLYGG